MEPADETMTDVLAQYAEAGFVGDAFASTGGQISCGTCSSCLSPAHVAIEGYGAGTYWHRLWLPHWSVAAAAG